jgi:hypothetical protein
LLAAGEPITLATDGPDMFGTDHDVEYLLCHIEFGVAPASFPTRPRLRGEIDLVVARPGG